MLGMFVSHKAEIGLSLERSLGFSPKMAFCIGGRVIERGEKATRTSARLNTKALRHKERTEANGDLKIKTIFSIMCLKFFFT